MWLIADPAGDSAEEEPISGGQWVQLLMTRQCSGWCVHSFHSMTCMGMEVYEYYIGGSTLLCQIIETVMLARCTCIFALWNIALGGYLDTRRNMFLFVISVLLSQ